MKLRENFSGERLRHMRTLRHLTRNDLAHELGITASGVRKLENGVSQPSLKILSKISNFFQVPTDYFLRDDTDEEILDSVRSLENFIKSEIMPFHNVSLTDAQISELTEKFSEFLNNH